MAVPPPQSTSLTTKSTAGIQPDAHSFLSITNLQPYPLLLLLDPFVNGLRISFSEANEYCTFPTSSSDDETRKMYRLVNRLIVANDLYEYSAHPLGEREYDNMQESID